MALEDLIKNRGGLGQQVTPGANSTEVEPDGGPPSESSLTERGERGVVAENRGTAVDARRSGGEGDSRMPSLVAPRSVSEEPRGVAEVTTPSGLQIYYQAAPKRLYRIRRDFFDAEHEPTVSPGVWWEVPSVSEVLEVLGKNLAWWGQRVGVEALIALSKKGVVNLHKTEGVLGEDLLPLRIEDVISLLTEHKLSVNHVRDKAGDRGTSVHDALESWATTGNLPAPNVYSEEERGYIRALNDFLIDSKVEPLHSEVMVASAEHRYAGRYDLLGHIPAEAEVVTKTYPKRRSIRTEIEQGGTWLLDAKTSKSVYKNHALQLAAYDWAHYECGYSPLVQYHGIIHLLEDGRYELVKSNASLEDFLAIRAAYETMQKDLL